MPAERVPADVFGTEWYIEPGAPPGLREGWLLDGVAQPDGRSSGSSATVGPRGGWDVDPDPGLDDARPGRRPRRLVDRLGAPPATRRRSRDQPDAAVPGDGGAVGRPWGVDPGRRADRQPRSRRRRASRSGERVPWLREAMAGRGPTSAARRTDYRDGASTTTSPAAPPATRWSSPTSSPSTPSSAPASGDDRLVLRSLDNTSVTVVETTPTAPGAGRGGRRGRHPDPLMLARQRHPDWHQAWPCADRRRTPWPGCGRWPRSAGCRCAAGRCGR